MYDHAMSPKPHIPKKIGKWDVGGAIVRGWVEDRIGPIDGASGRSRDIEDTAFCTPYDSGSRSSIMVKF